MASSCRASATFPYYVTCCITNGCNKLTSSPIVPSNKVTSCLVGSSQTPISKTCDSQDAFALYEFKG